jgi:hypothetical protein
MNTSPYGVKLQLLAAVAHNDPLVAWPAVKIIVERDYYIAAPNPKEDGAGEEIECGWANRSCKPPNGCLEEDYARQIIKEGERVWWIPNRGVMHLRCIGKTPSAGPVRKMGGDQ